MVIIINLFLKRQPQACKAKIGETIIRTSIKSSRAFNKSYNSIMSKKLGSKMKPTTTNLYNNNNNQTIMIRSRQRLVSALVMPKIVRQVCLSNNYK